jgi:hypothetical protein
MPSMQEALTDALEHPLAEPRRSTRPKRDGRKPAPHREGSSNGILWGVLGSTVGCLVVFGLYRGLARIVRR